MTPDWSALAKLVKAHQSFALTSHVRPDCDALGSELGMAGVLRLLGKDVVIANAQATPPNLAFIDPNHELKVLGESITAADVDRCQVVMVLDTSAWQQLGAMADVVRNTPAKKVVVDHHVSEDDLGAVPFKDTTAEATGRLVLDFANHLGLKITAEIAMPLFAATATDTGWFRFGSATPRTFRAAAEMIEAGARPSHIYRELYEQDTLARMQLRGIILQHIQTELDGRLAHTYVLREDFAATGALPSDTEDAINLALAIAGTQFAVILVEQPQVVSRLAFGVAARSIAARLPPSSAGVATRRPPARRWRVTSPPRSRSFLTLFGRRCDNSAANQAANSHECHGSLVDFDRPTGRMTKFNSLCLGADRPALT